MAKKKNNPWAICGANIKDQDSAKYERCVLKVKKKVGVKESVVDDIRKISEMLTDDPDVFTEEGLSMAPGDDMVGGGTPPPPPGGEGGGMPDMAPEGDMPPMPEEEGGQWIIVKMGVEAGGEGGEAGQAWGPYGSREEAIEELKACLQEEGMTDLMDQAESGKVSGEGFTKMVMALESGDKEEMPGEEEVGGEDLPPMGDEMGGDEMGPPADAAGGAPPTEEMGGGMVGMSGGY
jgi:hypothetical protein